MLAWIRARHAESRITMSVCNGALILAATGLLDGLTATTFHDAIDGLKAQFPRIHVVDDQRFVDNGRLVTTAGLSSGIDGAMHLVSRLDGQVAAQLVARNLEYDWREDSGYVRAALADYPMRTIFGSRFNLGFPRAIPRRWKTLPVTVRAGRYPGLWRRHIPPARWLPPSKRALRAAGW